MLNLTYKLTTFYPNGDVIDSTDYGPNEFQKLQDDFNLVLDLQEEGERYEIRVNDIIVESGDSELIDLVASK